MTIHITSEQINYCNKSFGSREIAWNPELEKGKIAEAKVRQALQNRGYKVTHFVMKDNATAADIKFLKTNGAEVIGEIKFLAGVSKGNVQDTLVFEVMTAAGYISHALREEFIKVYFFYNNYENEIFMFKGEEFRKHVHKLKAEGTVPLWDNNTGTWCRGVKVPWREEAAGYITSWSV